jgi:RHS repeat-associated protein
MRRLATLGIGLALLWGSATHAADTVYYIHTDALGSPVAMTDANRNVIERTQYAPYGQVLNRPEHDGPGYTGHEEDSATGLTNMQQRYAWKVIGRMISIDPVGVDTTAGASFNRYAYANDNPYRYTDPDGRMANQDQEQSPCTGSHIGGGACGSLNLSVMQVGTPSVTAMKAATARAPAVSPSSRNLPSVNRYTQEGESFLRYESGNSQFSKIGANGEVAPGTFAAPSSDGKIDMNVLGQYYKLPDAQIPRTQMFEIRPPAGTPIIGPRPVPGGIGNEVVFPRGAPPGSAIRPATPTRGYIPEDVPVVKPPMPMEPIDIFEIL